jgi:beta-phosphoglucomutase
MLKAVIFDCDGVIADSEPVHLALFQEILKEKGVVLTKEDYLSKYLAMDDRGCFRAVFQDNKKPISDGEIQILIDRKTALYKKKASESLVILPGVVEFVMALSQKYPLAVASGALRGEVTLMLDIAGLRHYFDVVVAAEDVANGKPAPDAFRKALADLNAKFPGGNIQPVECLVVEDSKHGVASAHAAGMKCLAVCSSYSAEELAAADKVVSVLTGIRVAEVEGLFM